MSVLLSCKDISMAYGEQVILKHIDIEIGENQRIGIIGANGVGKTTLANILAGKERQTGGKLTTYKKISIGYMAQNTQYKELEAHLSGGERTKMLLKQVLYNANDILILDEPTNHLDSGSIKWLIKAIKNYKGTVIIISHDRYFLDASVNQIEELIDGTLISYKGNYSFYRDEKKRRYEKACHDYYNQLKEEERIEAYMLKLKNWSNKAHKEAAQKARETGNKFGGREHNRAKAKKMDQRIKSQIKRLEKLKKEGIQKPQEEIKVRVNLVAPNKVGKRVIEAKNITKSYEGRVLFKDSSFYIKAGEKIGIYGPNGCGKSTLAKAIRGEIEVDGILEVSSGRKIGYMSQEVIDLNDELCMLDLFDRSTREKLNKLLATLIGIGFKQNDFIKRIGMLSLGQRMKLKLLLMIREGYDVLLLDEPTNHLDLHVRKQLENMLKDYTGTLILITHDRYMLENLCDKLLVYKNNHIIRYENTLSEYEAKETNTVTKKAQNKINNLILENRIACVVGQLSKLTSKDAAYKELEEKYMNLMALKNQE